METHTESETGERQERDREMEMERDRDKEKGIDSCTERKTLRERTDEGGKNERERERCVRETER